MNFVYPPSLIARLKRQWPKTSHYETKRPSLPDDRVLANLLEICYQASFLREEGRKLAYRVVFFPRKQFEKDIANKIESSFGLDHTNRFVVFTKPREFTVAELHRLAPAAEYVRSLICVELDQEDHWVTWGLLDTGANWWNFIHHETSGGMPPPARLTISSGNPGELVLSFQGDILFSLRNGAVQYPSLDLFSRGPIAAFLSKARNALYKETIEKLGRKRYSEEDNDYPERFYTFCLSRILSRIRDKQHGGTLLLVRDELSSDDSRLTDRAIIKYPALYDHAWSLMVESLVLHTQYYDLHFSLWDATAAIEKEKYRQLSLVESRREVNEEALSDCFRFIASLAGVDGAVIISDRLRLLGFGAEVIAHSPSLNAISVALDAEAKDKKSVKIESYGTRHRSAMRFCSSLEDSAAFIISQDGGVKATKRIGPDVVLWPDVNMGSLGI
jgi:hypothetical protein